MKLNVEKLLEWCNEVIDEYDSNGIEKDLKSFEKKYGTLTKRDKDLLNMIGDGAEIGLEHILHSIATMVKKFIKE